MAECTCQTKERTVHHPRNGNANSRTANLNLGHAAVLAVIFAVWSYFVYVVWMPIPEGVDLERRPLYAIMLLEILFTSPMVWLGIRGLVNRPQARPDQPGPNPPLQRPICAGIRVRKTPGWRYRAPREGLH